MICFLLMRRAASTHREWADSYLLQVRHWRGISASFNHTSRKQTITLTNNQPSKEGSNQGIWALLKVLEKTFPLIKAAFSVLADWPFIIMTTIYSCPCATTPTMVIYSWSQVTPVTWTTVVKTARSTNKPSLSKTLVMTPQRLRPVSQKWSSALDERQNLLTSPVALDFHLLG